MKNPNFDASNPLLIRPGTRFTKRLWLRSAKRRVGAALLAVASLSPFTGAHAQTQAQTHAQPMIVAHRGGTGDTPENTLQAFSTALADGADALWMTVQVTRDGVPVLYRPADLSSLTDGHGKIDSIDLSALRKLNAGYSFSRKDEAGQIAYPYRNHPLQIPTLREALEAIPPTVPLILDMKQTPPRPLVEGIAKVLDELHAWSRVRLYSTDARATALMAAHPQAQLFESRDATRDRLLQVALNNRCDAPPAAGSWVGIEYDRQLEVIEHYTLGAGVSKVDAHWWTPAAVQCFKSSGNVTIVAFGVETPDAYATAAALGIDAVMTDSPHTLKAALRARPPTAMP